jgi:nicotinamide-nucleotide amidase
VKAELVSVGTELLLGQIVDTNAAWLAQRLSALGIDCYYISAIGDNLGRLTEHLRRAWERSDLIVMTGGLGPTEDDLTREAISALLGEPMVVQPELERELREFFARRGVPMPERNIKQATLIASARALPNPIGTAPGWWVERDGRIIVAMPGVPVEMYRMWEYEVEPRLRARQGGAVILSKTLKVVGLGESAVEELLGELVRSTAPTVATYAKQDGIHVRLTAKALSRAEAEAIIAQMEPRIRAILGQHIYGVDDETLAQALARLLEQRDLTIATAEEVTGGLVASELMEAAGHRFLGGLVYRSFDCDAAPVIAERAARQFGAGLGLGVTSSPAGENKHNVFAAVWHQGRVVEHTRLYATTTAAVKRRALVDALNTARNYLLEGT